ncbi:MAG: hypothetical protein DRI34_08915 [Deltaproteobacteria bacterium]|nr:MAG: hypothetical protein DRI34_08915 [Deltaproteobacteria bacterium]
MKYTTLVLMLSTLLPLPARADNPARRMMEQVRRRANWHDMTGRVELILEQKNGGRRRRLMKLWSQTNERDETRMLLRLVEPADVRGTGFLLIEHAAGEDDRRLFLPALRRVQRISASGKGGAFMSSDFTYYDIGAPELDDWRFSLGADRRLGDVTCRTVVGRAASHQVSKDTGYSRVTWFIDGRRLLILGAEFHDQEGTLFKRLTVEKVENVNGVPFATAMRMENLLTGHRSEMRFFDLRVNQGLASSIFSERNLRRWTR